MMPTLKNHTPHTIRLITDRNELISCRDAWNQVAGRRPFLRWEWLVNWLLADVEPVEPAILVEEDEAGNWIGIAPLCLATTRLNRKLKFLGSGKACTDYMGLITVPGHESDFAEHVADWMTDHLRPDGPLGRIDWIELEGVCPDAPEFAQFSELLVASGFKSHTVPLEGCWVRELPSSWDTLNKGLSKSFRRKIKKVVGRLEAPDCRVLSSNDLELDQLWPVFVDLHQRRRQMLGQPGCFANPAFELFLKTATAQLANVGLAEVLIIEQAGEPFASMLLFNDGETIFMYQTGIDPERIAMEPGYQIVALAVRRSIKQQFKAFDFLRGDEPYKARWKTKRIPLVRQRFVPRHWTAQVQHELWRTGRSLRNYFRAKRQA